jgi:NitT/TauT family transport system substrate-binding protein
MALRRVVSRRGVLAGAAAGAALLPLPAIAELRAVKFTLAWLTQGSFAYVYVARAKGIMKARGIDFDIARGFGSMASAQAVAGGQFDFGIVAAPPLILSVAKGLPLIALAACDYDATMGVGVLDDSPITGPQDLAASVPTSGEFPFFPA